MLSYFFIAGFSAFVLLIAWLVKEGKGMQEAEDAAKILQKALDDAEKAKAVDAGVDRLADVDVINKLRDKWSRK
jgi:hypothetical protein